MSEPEERHYRQYLDTHSASLSERLRSFWYPPGSAPPDADADHLAAAHRAAARHAATRVLTVVGLTALAFAPGAIGFLAAAYGWTALGSLALSHGSEHAMNLRYRMFHPLAAHKGLTEARNLVAGQHKPKGLLPSKWFGLTRFDRWKDAKVEEHKHREHGYLWKLIPSSPLLIPLGLWPFHRLWISKAGLRVRARVFHPATMHAVTKAARRAEMDQYYLGRLNRGPGLPSPPAPAAPATGTPKAPAPTPTPPSPAGIGGPALGGPVGAPPLTPTPVGPAPASPVVAAPVAPEPAPSEVSGDALAGSVGVPTVVPRSTTSPPAPEHRSWKNLDPETATRVRSLIAHERFDRYMDKQRGAYRSALAEIADLAADGGKGLDANLATQAQNIAKEAVDKFNLLAPRDRQTLAMLGSLYQIAHAEPPVPLKQTVDLASDTLSGKAGDMGKVLNPVRREMLHTRVQTEAALSL